MSRRLREQAILEIVEDRVVSNQGQLIEFLGKRGIQTTQATVSRDVKRLGLIKRPASSGVYRYASPGSRSRSSRGTRQLKIACEQFLTGIENGGSLLILKTLTGRANALAVSIDETDLPGIAGTLAGDDTVLIILNEDASRQALRETLEEIVG